MNEAGLEALDTTQVLDQLADVGTPGTLSGVVAAVEQAVVAYVGAGRGDDAAVLAVRVG